MVKSNKRLATLVGCNYFNTRNELYGCINDVLAIREVLINRFGFHPNNIQLLTDEADSPVKPTGANIKKVLTQMIDQAEEGDVLYFHYSGHGTRVPRPGNSSQQDEAIVPCDFNLITDLDFRKLVNQLPNGVSFTILSDSCHSGGLIDKEKEQIGPISAKKTSSSSKAQNSKAIPSESILQHLASITGIESSDIGSHLFEAFGNEASIKFHPSQQHLSAGSVRPDAGILLSGCQANETSADMSPNEEGGKAYGAFSDAVEKVLKGHKSPLSNREVVTQARKLLQEGGYEQHPCLYCSDENADAPFLCQPKH
ncbi:hypothetical protein NE237_009070 [Protea cynaroides]|uniref:Peptidase C14 caspase domain-containing protein n=1 Tax=Protea cynaroides TaxID=273540 RepID=A0A9Q0KX11_9MAGN|nr:hypothetical protein NE237_009070 [Protea cynaroides]